MVHGMGYSRRTLAVRILSHVTNPVIYSLTTTQIILFSNKSRFTIFNFEYTLIIVSPYCFIRFGILTNYGSFKVNNNNNILLSIGERTERTRTSQRNATQRNAGEQRKIKLNQIKSNRTEHRIHHY